MRYKQVVPRIVTVVALALGGLAAEPGGVAAAQDIRTTAGCSGTLIRHQPIGSYGYLDIYYASGINCARTVASGSYWGQPKYMEVTLHVCANSTCTNWLSGDGYNDTDYGTFKYYAGPVAVDGVGRCIHWWAQIKTRHVTGHGHCG